MPYKNKQEAVSALLPGYVITGEAPNYVKRPNPDAGRPGQPAELQEQQGTILSINDPQNPSNPPDTIVIKEVGNAPWKGGVGFDVITGPQKAQPATASPASALQKLDENGDLIPPGGTATPKFVRDPKTGTTFQTNPDVKTDPSTWTPVKNPNDPSQTLGLWDAANNKFGATVPQAAQGTRRTGEYTDLIDPNDPNGKRVIGKVDTGTKEIFAVSRDPTLNKQIVSTPDNIYVFDDQGKLVNTVKVDKKSPYQAAVIDGVPFSFDPATGAFTKAPGDWQHPPIKDTAGNTMQWTTDADGSGKYAYPPGVTPAPTLQTNTTAKDFIWTDPVTGEIIKKTPNTNYQAPQVNLPTVNASSKMIPVPDPESPGGWKWSKNEARVTASQALQDMASQLSGRVVDGDISVEEAQAIIKSANDAMTTAAQAASTTVSAINQGAQAGANLLNQRVQAAQGFVNQGLGLLGQTKHGLLVAPPSDFGANLVSGAAGFATELGGGPEVFQAAANLVRRADPTGSMGQDAAAAYSTLTQMFQKYRQTHGGQPAPEEVQALKQGPAGAGTGQQATQQSFGAVPQAVPAITPGVASGQVAPSGAVAGQNYGVATAFPGGGAGGYANQSNPLSFKAPFAQSGIAEGSSRGFTPVPNPAAVSAPVAQSFMAPNMAVTPMQTVTPSNRNITITVPTG